MKKIKQVLLIGVSGWLLMGCAKKPVAVPNVSETSATSATTQASLEQLPAVSSETQQSTSVEEALVLTEGQKYHINRDFVDWAIGRAEIGGMAVSDRYFTHGAGGRGDWYANSVDGDIQLQDQQMPGYEGFAIHGIGGCVFYRSEDGVTGWDAQVSFASNASNHYVNLDRSQPLSIYLLGDNGVVYEKKSATANGQDNKYAYGEYSDEGHRFEDPPGIFRVSEDQAAHETLKALIATYSKQTLTVPAVDMANYVSIPLPLVGLWRDAQGNDKLKIDETHVTLLPQGTTYKISEVSQEGNAYTIAWDMADFSERYGTAALGPGPQPFLFEVSQEGQRRVLRGGEELYSNVQH